TDEAAVAAAVPKTQVAIDVIARELGEKPYLVGERASLADFMLAPQIAFLAVTPEWATLSAAHANLGRWLARMDTHLGMQATTWERVAAMAAPLKQAS